jgi:glucan phosphoethanolaminetransferase (alkaline phosphatase superfamily)
MPKTYPKAQPKKKKTQKTPPKQISIISSKYYWITLTLMTVVFGSAYLYTVKIAMAATVLLLVSALYIIAFACYINFKPSFLKASRRATFIFVGASIIGFCMWAAIVLLLDATGFWLQISGSIGYNAFGVTSLIICLVSGAFIGDLIGNNKERISTFLRDKLAR